ncbi:type II toxin-antitoxin system Phd/YefM family antitoxin [Frankia sp. CiP3]|uniref:type II toxin-antitoxin system Phd/YefM family antitoxin n=1 Tax=Frankia sp. CiP3 TaxID=2880971 RepID=UPI001EF4B5F5|nr:type II toxin-antitoxin system prevent-host-death family antitoxin [Frankia sp. CiP3]
MSGMTVGQASINARDLSRHAASVLDRVEHGERLVVTRGGEPIAEIIPIARTQRLVARWVWDGLIPEPPPTGYATAAAVASAAQGLPSVPAGRTATDVLHDTREDER